MCSRAQFDMLPWMVLWKVWVVGGGRGDVDKFLERALHTLIATACASTLECLLFERLFCRYTYIMYIYIYLGNKEI